MKGSVRHATSLLFMATCGVVLSSGAGFANVILSAGPTWGIDDYNSVQATAPTPVLDSYTVFLNSAFRESGFLTSSWDWTLASAQASDYVRNNTTIDPYVAWVVSEPRVTFPNGDSIAGGFNDIGGVNVLFQFVPNDPTGPLGPESRAAALNNKGSTQLHWLQLVYRYDNLGQEYIRVDNGSSSSPWYDATGEAGIATQDGYGSWLGDAPNSPENGPDVPDPGTDFPGSQEPVDPYLSTVEFETFLAVDNIVSGVNDVTLYGGWDWGYTYTANDIAEPSSLSLAASALLAGWLVSMRRRSRQMVCHRNPAPRAS